MQALYLFVYYAYFDQESFTLRIFFYEMIAIKGKELSTSLWAP